MTDSPLFETFSEALIAAHRKSRMVECGYAYAVQWPLGHCTDYERIQRQVTTDKKAKVQIKAREAL